MKTTNSAAETTFIMCQGSSRGRFICHAGRQAEEDGDSGAYIGLMRRATACSAPWTHVLKSSATRTSSIKKRYRSLLLDQPIGGLLLRDDGSDHDVIQREVAGHHSQRPGPARKRYHALGAIDVTAVGGVSRL